MRKLLLAAAALALATPALAYTPTICHFGPGYAACQPVLVNPSAKIINVDPVERLREPEASAAVPPTPSPLPLDRPRRTIQQ